MNLTALAPLAPLGHVLAVLITALLNNLGPLLVAGLIAYAFKALHTAIPGLVACVDRALGLHLSAAREAAYASAVDRAVYAVQGRVAIPADRRDAVARDVAGRFPGLDPDHLDTLIDAAISGAKLQHGTDAWRALAPTTPANAPTNPDDVNTLVRDAFQAGQQAILAGLATLQAQALAGATAPSVPPVAPLSTPLPAGTVAEIPVNSDGEQGAPVNVAPAADTLHIVNPATGHVEGVITPPAQATA